MRFVRSAAPVQKTGGDGIQLSSGVKWCSTEKAKSKPSSSASATSSQSSSYRCFAVSPGFFQTWVKYANFIPEDLASRVKAPERDLSACSLLVHGPFRSRI